MSTKKKIDPFKADLSGIKSSVTIPDKPLKADQVRYLRQRLEALRDQKVATINGDPQYGELGWGAVRSLLNEEIRLGHVVVDVDKMRDATAGADLHTVLRFSRYPNGEKDAEREVGKLKAERDQRVASVIQRVRHLIDVLVLGDAAGALEAIRSFESEQF